MLVGEILKTKAPEIISVTPGQTMVEVLRLFRDRNIGFVIVSRSTGEYLGTVSERDCAMPWPTMEPRRPRCGSRTS